MVSMMADSCFDGERQFYRPPSSSFSSRRGGRCCRRIAAVRVRCRRGVVSPTSDKPHSTLDIFNQNILVQTRQPKTLWSSLVDGKKLMES